MPFTGVNVGPTTQLYAGHAADNTFLPCDSFVNAEASAELAFGTFVARGANGTREAKNLAAQADRTKLLGVVLNTQKYSVDVDLGTAGLKPKVMGQAVQRGRMWVHCSHAVNPTSTVRMRMTTGSGAVGTPTGPGTLCTAAEAGVTVVIASGVRFTSTTTGANPVQIDFDMNAITFGTVD